MSMEQFNISSMLELMSTPWEQSFRGWRWGISKILERPYGCHQRQGHGVGTSRIVEDMQVRIKRVYRNLTPMTALGSSLTVSGKRTIEVPSKS